MHSSIHSITIYNKQDLQVTKMSIDGWMDKDTVLIYDGMLLSHKKDWNNAICGNMDGHRDDRISEVILTKTNIRLHRLYVKSKKWYKWTSHKAETESQVQKTSMVIRGNRGGINWETGVDICMLLYKTDVFTLTYKIRTYCIAQGTVLSTL